jgi:hypothetical protein
MQPLIDHARSFRMQSVAYAVEVLRVQHDVHADTFHAL